MGQGFDSNLQLHRVLDTMVDAVAVSRRGVHVFVNRAFLRLFGYEHAGELLGKPLINAIGNSEKARIAGYVKARAAGEAVPTAYHTRGRRGDGSEFDLEVHVSSYEDGGETLTVALLRDVSRQKQLEDSLRQAQKMDAVGRLAGGLAHDFNNLLTIIDGYARMALDRLPEGAPGRFEVGHVIEASERAGRLLSQLQSFSRRQAAKPRNLDVNEALRPAAGLLAGLLGENVTLRMHLSSRPLVVRIDPGLLEQAVMNLSVNARDALRSGGEYAIESDLVAASEAGELMLPETDWVRLTFADNGPGMTEEVRSRLFEPFFTTKEKGKGMGLGLAITYGVVRQAGGEIRVDSEPGRGARFDIYLPRAEGEIETPASKADVEESWTGTETVLLVEDEPALRQLAEEILTRNGYQVVPAGDAMSAILQFEEHGDAVDVLLTDIVMPVMNGRELAQRLREIRPGLKVAFMSGYAEQAMPSSSEGVFLPKPFTPRTLCRAVRDALAG